MFFYFTVPHKGNVIKTKLGLAWRATAGDAEIARVCGVNTNNAMALSYILGYGFAAAAGVHEYTGIRSYFRKSHTAEVEDRAEAVIREVGLADVANKKASDVSLGYLRRLEIARALVTEPKLIMLDEPCAGLSNFAINEITELIMKLKAQGQSIVLIEHNLPITMKVCDRITVLSYGKKIAEGTPDVVKNDKQVIEAYLGEEDD